ncbi:hypothetical protein ACVIW0_002178 [Bradyrhizobium sp. USDA 4454]
MECRTALIYGVLASPGLDSNEVRQGQFLTMLAALLLLSTSYSLFWLIEALVPL